MRAEPDSVRPIPRNDVDRGGIMSEVMNGVREMKIPRYGYPDGAAQGAHPARFQFYPPLLVGLGTTGLRVLAHIRHVLAERSPGLADQVVFLGVDTDTRGRAIVGPQDFCYIGLPTGEGRRLLRSLDAGEYAEIASWYDPALTLDDIQGNGSGTVRMAGRVQLYYRFKALDTAIQRAQQRLQGTAAAIRRMVATSTQNVAVNPSLSIYFFGSVCGGTGAGILLDVLAYFDHMYQDNDVQRKAYLFLPNAFDEYVQQPGFDRSRLEANAFSTLSELEHHLSAQALRKRPGTFEWPDRRRHTVTDPLLNRCYVIEKRNKSYELRSLEDTCMLVARAVAAEIGTPLADHQRSRMVDQLTHVLDQPDRFTGRERVFSALSTSTLVKTPARLERHIWLSRLQRLAAQILGRDATEQFEGLRLEDAVPGFLRETELADPEGGAPIWRTLLRTPEGQPLPALSALNLPVIAREWGGGRLRGEILSRHERIEQLIARAGARHDLIDEIRARQEAVERHSISAFERIAGRLARQHGSHAAAVFVEQLRTFLREAIDSLQAGSRQLGEQREVRRRTLQDTRLLRRWALLAPFHGRDERQRAIRAFHRIAAAETEIFGREAAVRLAHQLDRHLEAAHEHAGALLPAAELLHSRATARRRDLEEWLRQARAHDGFTLEQEMLTPSDCRQVAEEDARTATGAVLFGEADEVAQEYGVPLDALALALADALESDSGASTSPAAEALRERWLESIQTLVHAEHIIKIFGTLSQEGHGRVLRGRLEAFLHLPDSFCRFNLLGDVSLAHSGIILYPRQDPDAQRQIEELLAEHVDSLRHQWSIDPLVTPYLFALQVVRHEHGFSAYNLVEWQRFAEAYFHWIDKARHRPVDRSKNGWRDTPVVPVLTEDLTMCALALALGYVARAGDRFIFGVASDGGALFRSDHPTLDLPALASVGPPRAAGLADGEPVGTSRKEVRRYFQSRYDLRKTTRTQAGRLQNKIREALMTHIEERLVRPAQAIREAESGTGAEIRLYFQYLEEAAALRAYVEQIPG